MASTPVVYRGSGTTTCAAPLCELRRVDVEIEDLRVGVDHDPVPVGDERDRPAVDRLGRDVADAVAVRAAREPPVGDERTVAAAAGALHGSGDGQHLAHARAALRALVADDDDGAGLDRAGEDRVERGLLAVEDPGGPGELRILVEAGDLHDAALRGERAREDGDPTVGVDRARTAGGRPRRRAPAGRCASRFSATVDPVTVRQSPSSSPASRSSRITTGTPTDPVEVDHVVAAVRLHVGDVRDRGPQLR